MTRLALLILLLACAVGGCGGDNASYTPKSSDTLFAEIASIDGVTAVDIGAYESSGAGSGPKYNGQVGIDDAADPLQILDQVLAILRQGMPDAALNVEVRQGDAFYPAEAVGLSAAGIEERYGPQPGTGVPPTDQPALTLRE